MKLPYGKNAYVPKEKFTEYLLSETHAVGKLKAKFFKSAGFDETNVTQLERVILAIAHDEEVKEVISSPYGKKYVIDGTLSTSSKKKVKIQTVWIIETGEKRPRFVTAYPV